MLFHLREEEEVCQCKIGRIQGVRHQVSALGLEEVGNESHVRPHIVPMENLSSAPLVGSLGLENLQGAGEDFDKVRCIDDNVLRDAVSVDKAFGDEEGDDRHFCCRSSLESFRRDRTAWPFW